MFIAAENTWQGIVYNSCPTVKFLSKSLKMYQNQEWEGSWISRLKKMSGSTSKERKKLKIVYKNQTWIWKIVLHYFILIHTSLIQGNYLAHFSDFNITVNVFYHKYFFFLCHLAQYGQNAGNHNKASRGLEKIVNNCLKQKSSNSIYLLV